jgi:hypothetical protein
MGLSAPYKRTVRQLKDGSYSNNGNGAYIWHPNYAVAPTQYIKAFLLLQKDLEKLFDYIEPADVNLNTFSFRIHELLIRVCIEVEANLKAILTENGYQNTNAKRQVLDFTMKDYCKINNSHLLSEYCIKIPNWHGTQKIVYPFHAWGNGKSLAWYNAYNAVKHDRFKQFEQASFKNLIDAMSGLVVLLSSQFITEDFGSNDFISWNGTNRDGFETAIGGYFQVKFPIDTSEKDRYDFEWFSKSEDDRIFEEFDYHAINN